MSLSDRLVQLFEQHPGYHQSPLYVLLSTPQPSTEDLRYFLRFQFHFYHFVRVFSKMLARAAADIEYTPQRLHLMENLMYEHGLPSGVPHVETYRQYLNCLAEHLGQRSFDEVDFSLPGNGLQQIVADFEQLPAGHPDALLLLGGIEYVYAVISRDIVAFLERAAPGLAARQQHYAIHAELDWQHGWEFVDTYLTVAADAGRPVDETQLCATLAQGGDHLVRHIVRLMAFESVPDKPLGFYYAREDSAVEAHLIAQRLAARPQLNILAVCGGGENHIRLANAFPDKRFAFRLFDINPNQLALAAAKLGGQTDHRFAPPEYHAKFEHLFAQLRRYADLHHGCRTVFHRDNLIHYFGPQAVLGCRAAHSDPLVFAEHFYRALSSRPEHWNSRDITGQAPASARLQQDNLQLLSQHLWDIAEQAVDAPPEDDYDLVMLSNVFDWLPADAIAAAWARIVRLCRRPDTLFVLRRLLSDYDVAATAEVAGLVVIDHSAANPALYDATGFYSHSYVLQVRR